MAGFIRHVVEFFTREPAAPQIHIHMPKEIFGRRDKKAKESKKRKKAEASSDESIYRRDADGNFVKAKSCRPISPAESSSSDSDSSREGAIRKSPEAVTSGKNSKGELYTISKKPSLVSKILNGGTKGLPAITFNPQTWDGLPDGDFEFPATQEEYQASKKLVTHWPCSRAGDPRGSKDAETWEGGKRQHRQCLGYISCVNSDCKFVIWPQVRSIAARNTQLAEKCPLCESNLQIHPCPARGTVYEWKHGYHYVHRGTHNHPPLSHHLHLTAPEEAQLEAVIAGNPSAGALSLVVGGPGHPSVGKISKVLMNQDRVRKEQEKVRRKMNISSSDDFMADFAAFELEYDALIKRKSMGKLGMISLQSPFMAKLPLADFSTLVKNSSDVTDAAPEPRFPVGGTISDAAHGFFKDGKAVLIISSCYSSVLQCWVPILMSYAYGQSTEYYEEHFLAMMESIAADAEERGLEFIDEMLAGVADFSVSQSSGFTGAFVRFWHPESELVDELWGDRKCRRGIRLGRWNLAFKLKQETSDDEILFKPGSIPYTEEILLALTPYSAILEQLLHDPDTVDVRDCPVKLWTEEQHKHQARPIDAIPYFAGPLSVNDQAGLNNWFDLHIPGAQGSREEWVSSSLAIAHARTLLILHRNRARFEALPDFPMEEDDGLMTEHFMLAQAWQLQCDTQLHEATDVDMEAVSVLEQSIFTHSDESGVAGNQQWGLDVGPLQDGWYPYADTPYYWQTRVGADDENELAHGPGYQVDMEVVPAAEPVTETVTPAERPKPRPVQRR